MISDKYFRYIIVLIIACFLMSCGHVPVGEKGWFLEFKHIPTESLRVVANDYISPSIDLPYADLRVRIMASTSSGQEGDKNPNKYKIEKLFSQFLDPNGNEYNGGMPLFVEYTTEECISISIDLYDTNHNLVGDITDKAQFYYIWDQYEKGYNFFLNADCTLVGKIEIGMTIADYLALHPMVFPDAHFVFPSLDKDIFAKGYYIRCEVELGNGKKLIGYSSAQ